MAEVTFEDTNAGGQAPTPGAAAYACSRLGFRVFPLVPGTGTPALKAYPDYATTDPDVIASWWGSEYAGYGVGIACGPASGMWALDIDTKKGVNGYNTLSALARMHHAFGPEGLSFALDTLVVRTPSGGAHIYFRWAEGVVNSTGRLGPGLDVRADHGYVRAPGWNGYAVVPRGADGVRPTAVREAPQWLVRLAYKRRADREGDRMAQTRPGTSWAAYSTSATLRTLGNAPEGTRNTALNKAAYKMGLSGAIGQEEAWAACQSQLVGMGAGDGMDAWRRTFESGWNAGAEHRANA